MPAEALREIVINAVIHRDVSTPSSYVAIAVFDDRIEVRSIGDFPSGVRAEQLAHEHLSVRRNPLCRGVPSHRRHRGVGPRHEPGHRGLPGIRHPRP